MICMCVNLCLKDVTDITTPPIVLVDPSSPGHVVVTWDRRGENCFDEGQERNRVIGYRILLTSYKTGWTLDTNFTAPGVDAICKNTLLTENDPEPFADNCSSIHLYELAEHSFYEVTLVRISLLRLEIRSPNVKFKTPCGS